MPAVTADTTTLPRLPERQPGSRDRAGPFGHDRTRRGSKARASPSAGPSPASTWPTSTRSSTWTRWARSTTRRTSRRGTDWHPHRGFETVTYIIDGTFQHQDSHGGGGVIANGATQWMTAGGGILHIETPPEELVISGGLFHGVQLWVNLPPEDKMTAPRYQNLDADQVTLVSSPDGGALAAPDRRRRRRLPRARDRRTRRSSWPTPPSRPAPASRCPWPADFNALAYVLAGDGSVGRRAPPGRERPAGGVRGRRRRVTVDGRRRRRAARGPAARRPADPRAGRRLRPVRHEHQGRAGPGRRGLQRRTPRHHPGRRPASIPSPLTGAGWTHADCLGPRRGRRAGAARLPRDGGAHPGRRSRGVRPDAVAHRSPSPRRADRRSLVRGDGARSSPARSPSCRCSPSHATIGTSTSLGSTALCRALAAHLTARVASGEERHVMDPVLAAIRSRRVVRAMTAEPVARATIEAILDAGRWASTAGNRHLQRFVATDHPGTLRVLRMVAPGMIQRPTAAITVCIDRASSFRLRVPAERHRPVRRRRDGHGDDDARRPRPGHRRRTGELLQPGRRPGGARPPGGLEPRADHLPRTPCADPAGWDGAEPRPQLARPHEVGAGGLTGAGVVVLSPGGTAR